MQPDRWKHIVSHRLFLPLCALGVLLLFNAFFVPDFFKIEMLDGRLFGRPVDILNRSSSLILLALGMTFVIATGGIDISVGAIIAISGAVCCSLLGGRGDGVPDHPLWMACAVAVGVSMLAGVWNGLLVARLKVNPMVATLILMTAGRGIAQLITEGQIITVYYRPFSYIGGCIPGSILPTTMYIAALMIALVLFIMKRTSIGLMIQSVGINPTASRYTGLKVTQIVFLTYVFSGFCAGVAGLMESSMIRAADANNAGLSMEMDAILAVTLGGTLLTGGKFSIWGSVIGAITIQTLTTTMYAVGVASDQLPVIKAVVVILICLAQSERIKRLFREMALRSQLRRSGTA